MIKFKNIPNVGLFGGEEGSVFAGVEDDVEDDGDTDERGHAVEGKQRAGGQDA